MAESGTQPSEVVEISSIPEEQTPETFASAEREEILGETPRNNANPGEILPVKKTARDRREVFRVLELVERDSSAIAESYVSLFSTLRQALSEVTSTSFENMQCLSDIVGSLQVSALDAATKGNRYINSCLRLNQEIRSMEGLALELKTLRKNVDTLELAVNRLVRLT